jgi:hypothetical protein
MEATSLRFAAAARSLGQTSRRRGLAVPGFRSPPRLPEVDRSLRRRSDGVAMVAIRIRGRPWMAVVSDMIEGVVAANRLRGPDADGARRVLWAGLDADALLPASPTQVPRPVPVPTPAKVAPAATKRRPTLVPPERTAAA